MAAQIEPMMRQILSPNRAQARACEARTERMT